MEMRQRDVCRFIGKNSVKRRPLPSSSSTTRPERSSRRNPSLLRGGDYSREFQPARCPRKHSTLFSRGIASAKLCRRRRARPPRSNYIVGDVPEISRARAPLRVISSRRVASPDASPHNRVSRLHNLASSLSLLLFHESEALLLKTIPSLAHTEKGTSCRRRLSFGTQPPSTDFIAPSR